ncbi:hypothetical protein GCM10009682_12090 [Luedemannella flava]|uniref:Uncharacterized protein n=1 Tax=Luedemannella flava TaxID=349316 RepID=A0ABP4XTH0_9ACTN
MTERDVCPASAACLTVADKGKADCGDHEWYNHDDVVEHCYHCAVGSRPRVRPR